MDSIFNLDNWFFRFMEKLLDCVILNLLWILTSLPLFTIGASTTALYHTVVKALRKDHGTISKEFWHSFFSNFRQATVIWIIILALFLFLAIDCAIVAVFLEAGAIMKWILGILIGIFAVSLVWSQFCFSYTAKYTDPIKNILKNALFFLLSHLEKSVWILAILGISIMLFISPLGPLMLLFFPTASVFAISLITEKIYASHSNNDHSITASPAE